MQLVVHPSGNICGLYGEVVDLAKLGELFIWRASHVEPDESGHWFADLAPCDGPRLGPFSQRSAALVAEERWLNEHWLLKDAHATLSHEKVCMALAVIA